MRTSVKVGLVAESFLFFLQVSDVVSLKERGKYQGITGCVVALANSCGPIVGGAFTERASWRWCFVSLPKKLCYDPADT